MLGDLSSGGGGGGWGRSGDEVCGAEVCWDKEGGLKPVSLEDMNEEEKEVRYWLLPPSLQSFMHLSGHLIVVFANVRLTSCSPQT